MKLEITEPQLKALIDLVESAHSMLEEVPEERRNCILVKRMFKKNGYSNVLGGLK